MTNQPTLKQEEWRYSDPAALRTYTPPASPDRQIIEGEAFVLEVMEPGSTAMAFDIAAGAHLTHLRLAPSGINAPAFAHAHVNIDKSGTYTSIFANFTNTYVRNEIHVDLNAAGAHADLRGAYLLSDQGHCDTLTRVHHAAADTTSDEVYKGVLTDQARGVFQAQIRVAPDAQRIVGNQMHRALMLSDDARVDAKPELEIFADDVQCSHGATVGDLDTNQMFYLRSRGIPLSQARALLIEAFLTDILAAVPQMHRETCERSIQNFLTTL